MSTETPTPRTDAASGFAIDANDEWAQSFEKDPTGAYVPADFARTLEREVTALRAQRDALAKPLSDLLILTKAIILAWRDKISPESIQEFQHIETKALAALSNPPPSDGA